jgi:hypothetical protein
MQVHHRRQGDEQASGALCRRGQFWVCHQLALVGQLNCERGLPYSYGPQYPQRSPGPTSADWPRLQLPRGGKEAISSVVLCIGPLLSDDPQRREWATERPGAISYADGFAFEGGCDFDDRCALSHESP